MSADALSWLGFVGLGFVMLCATVGAFVILRWGWTGVEAIWSIREEMDEAVKRDLLVRMTRGRTA